MGRRARRRFYLITLLCPAAGRPVARHPPLSPFPLPVRPTRGPPRDVPRPCLCHPTRAAVRPHRRPLSPPLPPSPPSACSFTAPSALLSFSRSLVCELPSLFLSFSLLAHTHTSLFPPVHLSVNVLLPFSYLPHPPPSPSVVVVVVVGCSPFLSSRSFFSVRDTFFLRSCTSAPSRSVVVFPSIYHLADEN